MPEPLGAAALSLLVVAVAVHDARTGRIPNPVTAPLIGAGLLWAAWQTLARGPDGAAFAAGALIVAVAFGLWLAGGLGAGDVKLLVGLALFLGSWAYARALLGAALLGTLALLALQRRNGAPRAARLPQAGWIAAATLLHVWGPLLEGR